MSQRWHQAVSYLNYVKQAKGRHGTHSPFVYDFLEQLLKAKHNLPKWIREERRVLLSSNEILKVEDHGAGSQVNRNTERTVDQIAKHALMPMAWQRLLLAMSQSFKPSSVLELGTSLGLTAVALAKALPQATIHSVEASPAIANYAKGLAAKKATTNLTIHTALFDEYLPSALKGKTFDWVIVDGNHTYDATVRYFEMLTPHMSPGSMLLFDDIYWSKEMTEAWEYIKGHSKAVLTIDLYRWGLVFFPENTEKQDFVLKSGISPLSR